MLQVLHDKSVLLTRDSKQRLTMTHHPNSTTPTATGLIEYRATCTTPTATGLIEYRATFF